MGQPRHGQLPEIKETPRAPELKETGGCSRPRQNVELWRMITLRVKGWDGGQLGQRWMKGGPLGVSEEFRSVMKRTLSAWEASRDKLLVKAPRARVDTAGEWAATETKNDYHRTEANIIPR